MRAENIGAPGGGGGPACHDAKVLHIHFEGAQVVGTRNIVKSNIFIEPESDHWQCLSLTDSLTHCRLVNLIDVTLACEDDH